MQHQAIPPGDWKLWEMMTDRAAGKTFGGAHATAEMAKTVKSIALIGPSFLHIQETMVHGPSGILALDLTAHRDSRDSIIWESGAKALFFPDRNLDAIRGLDFGWVWWDEPTLNHFCPRQVWQQEVQACIRQKPGKTLMTMSPPAGVVQTYARTRDNTRCDSGLIEKLKGGA